MQQKGENVAHAQDGIRPKKLKIQGACGIRHPQAATQISGLNVQSTRDPPFHPQNLLS
jgi:hypothetical protein